MDYAHYLAHFIKNLLNVLIDRCNNDKNSMALRKGWQLLDSKSSDDDKCGKRLLPQGTAKLECNLTGVDYITSFCLYKNWRMHTWSYFGRNVPGHNRTKIGPITFFTNFGSTMSKYTVGIRKNIKKSLKTHFMDYG